ncbi:MAG: Superoxide dismutase [Candidatus Uhrbacteria bacterium GW2011_GWF2_40_263]|nr:MAG: Superoxide dismutase [Candidatus Uhrbacteria bacterium GW2011_GWF2_40_263]
MLGAITSIHFFMFTLPSLPFDPKAFGTFISEETFSYHHDKHHAGYVSKLNAAIEGTSFIDQDLETIIQNSRANNSGVFNNAAQHFNHSFFWNSLSEKPQNITEELNKLLVRDFGSVEYFKEQFTQVASSLFGSGWTWLVQNNKGTLAIIQTANAETPVGTDQTPLLTIDVWEHAYYIDHRNARPAYLEAFWPYVNWQFVATQLV